MGYGYQGDSRRVRRGERLFDAIVESGCVVMRKLSGGRAAEVAAHRFLGSPEVTPDALLAALSDRTQQACRGRYVVAAQDTTEINFSGADRGRRGLGLAGDGKSLGFFAHAVVAIDADDEAVLGIAGARIWTRGMDKATLRQKRHLEDKLANGGLLFETGALFAPIVGKNVKVAPQQPRRPGDQGRIAHVELSYGQVTIAKPKTGRATPDAKQATLNLVVAREVGEPGSGPRVLWRLLTTLPVETVDDAEEVIRLYRLRWRIEQVFRVLKRDGLALEETQIEDAARLFNLTALALGAAARIIQLTDARDASNRPASDVIDPSLIEAAHAISKTLEGKTDRQKNRHPPGSLTWLAWIIARLGGWNCYYKPPGPKTMADGWRRLAYMLGGYAIAQAKSNV